MLPRRIQNAVDREHRHIQDAEWDIKNDEADEKVKIILATEFPDFFKRKFLDPYEEGSDLYDENQAFLQSIQQQNRKLRVLRARAINWEQPEPRMAW